MLVPPAPSGFRFYGRTFQAFPPAEATWPEPIVAAIRHDVDPGFVPMWCWNVYKGPGGGLVKLGRHWIWLEVRDLVATPRTPRYVPATHGVNAMRRPNVTFRALQAPQTKEQKLSGLAGDPLDFGWWLYEELKRARDTYEPDADKVIADLDAGEKANEEKAMGALWSETAYRWKHDESHMQKIADRASGPELAHVGPAVEWTPRPFVDLKGSTT